MAMNLRLDAGTVEALRERSRETGRSQQDLLREAVGQYLGLSPASTPRQAAIASGLVRPPTPFIDVPATEPLPAGRTTADLLDRDDDR